LSFPGQREDIRSVHRKTSNKFKKGFGQLGYGIGADQFKRGLQATVNPDTLTTHHANREIGTLPFIMMTGFGD
jgi:hypothetical protein